MKAKQRTLGVLLFLILLAGGVFALLTLRNAGEEQAAIRPLIIIPTRSNHSAGGSFGQ